MSSVQDDEDGAKNRPGMLPRQRYLEGESTSLDNPVVRYAGEDTPSDNPIFIIFNYINNGMGTAIVTDSVKFVFFFRRGSRSSARLEWKIEFEFCR